MSEQRMRRETVQAIGFTVLGEPRDVRGFTPQMIDRYFTHLDIKPRFRVDAKSADGLTKTEESWLTNARDCGLLAPDGSVLMCITNPRTFKLPWIRARGFEQEGFLRKLHQITGWIEFVSITPGADRVVALMQEDRENWIVNLDIPQFS